MSDLELPIPLPGTGTAIAFALTALFITVRAISNLKRREIEHSKERVLVIGASTGVGREIARRYTHRGARVCVVARKPEEISVVADELGERCIWAAADFSRVDEMVKVREKLEKEWGGVDSIHVCAGVSALQPMMAVAGVKKSGEDASTAGLQRAVDVAGRATQGNFVGPLLSALTFIPMLERTSKAPSILLIASVAAVVPAPTRALYAATKASALLLYQSLAIEHPKINFTFMMPATIQGNFRASAVDAGPVREADPNKHGLKIDYVASKCIDAMDTLTTGNVVLPWFPYALGHYLYYLCPSLVERQARKKYNFEA